MQQSARLARRHDQSVGNVLAFMVSLIDQPTTLRVEVDDGGNVEPSFGRPDVIELGHFLLVGSVCCELAIRRGQIIAPDSQNTPTSTPTFW
jgi:hypothetical protein